MIDFEHRGRSADRAPASRRGLATRLAVALVAFATLGAAAPAAPPEAVSTYRRLSQDQYRQSIADIFGSDIRISGRLEPDPRRDGLIAIGVANAPVGAAGFEQYDMAAREIAAQVTDDAHRKALIPCTPSDAAAPDKDCARAFLTSAGRLLFRRPLSSGEADRLVDIAARGAAAKSDFHAGLAVALATMLESPSFLYRTERAVRDARGYRLDDYSAAARLSFLIWNAPPDAALLDAVARGELATATGLTREVDRMLASPRLEQGVRAFFDDMLALDRVPGLQKDPAIYPRFSNRLAHDAREQTLRTIVDTLLRRNEDYRSLFTTRRTFLSRSLGLLYSEPVTSPTGWVAHEFPAGDTRVGILAQPAFLMAYSHPGRSSPTLRGKAVRELLLCQKVPAPPANVDFALVQNVTDPRFATARQRLFAHNSEPMCAACHKMMDPLGLPLEGFDGVASMRSQENGASLDLGGDHAGTSFAGSAGLGAALAGDPALSSCLVNRLYSYGAGRSVDGEPAWIDAIRARYEAEGLRIRDILRAIALSDEFYRLEGETDPATIALQRPRSAGMRGDRNGA